VETLEAGLTLGVLKLKLVEALLCGTTTSTTTSTSAVDVVGCVGWTNNSTSTSTSTSSTYSDAMCIGELSAHVLHLVLLHAPSTSTNSTTSTMLQLRVALSTSTSSTNTIYSGAIDRVCEVNVPSTITVRGLRELVELQLDDSSTSISTSSTCRLRRAISTGSMWECGDLLPERDYTSSTTTTTTSTSTSGYREVLLSDVGMVEDEALLLERGKPPSRGAITVEVCLCCIYNMCIYTILYIYIPGLHHMHW
jgi:hypothetical protein